MSYDYNKAVLSARRSRTSYFSYLPRELLTFHIFPYLRNALEQSFQRVSAFRADNDGILMCPPSLVWDTLLYIRYIMTSDEQASNRIACGIYLCYHNKSVDEAEYMVVAICTILRQNTLHKHMSKAIECLINNNKFNEKLYTKLVAIYPSAFTAEHYKELLNRSIINNTVIQNEYILHLQKPIITEQIISAIADLLKSPIIDATQLTLLRLVKYYPTLYDFSEDIWTIVLQNKKEPPHVKLIIWLHDNNILHFSDLTKLRLTKLLARKKHDIPLFLLDLNESNLDQLMDDINDSPDNAKELIRRCMHIAMLKVLDIMQE